MQKLTNNLSIKYVWNKLNFIKICCTAIEMHILDKCLSIFSKESLLVLTENYYVCFLFISMSNAGQWFSKGSCRPSARNIKMSDSQDCFLCSKPATGTCPDCALVHYCSDSHLRSHKPFGDCLPFRVGFVEGVGRVVLAVRNIKAGDVVITEHSIVKGPGNKTPPSCLQCLRQWEGETTCTKCGWPVCNEKCQAGDIHEIECTN